MNDEETGKSVEKKGNNPAKQQQEVKTSSSESRQQLLSSSSSEKGAGKTSEKMLGSGTAATTSAKTATSSSTPFPKSATLLGSDELSKHLQNRQAVFQLTTWNMGSLPLPDEQSLNKIFYHHQYYNSVGSADIGGGLGDGDMMTFQTVDVHVVSIQECWPDAEALELQLQMCLCPHFALFHSVSFGTLHMSIFIRRDLLWFTCECAEISQTLRSGRLFKTKGFIGVAFGLFGSRFLFINTHLSAGDDHERESQRAEELKRVIALGKGVTKSGSSSSNSGKKAGSAAASSSLASSYDSIFLCGDLNFRISKLTRDKILDELKTDNLEALLIEDQLRKLLIQSKMSKSVLNGFEEAAKITFRPTYKYDLGTDNFDSSSKKRSPAYTDRIIFNCKRLPTTSEPIVTCLSYESVKELKTSDHRPVYAIFSVTVKPGFDTLPLTGAQFKREVFVKAIQQRAKFLLDQRKKIASSACSVM